MAKSHPYRFGYHWIWTYGHLIPTGAFAAGALVAYTLGAPWWLVTILMATAAWAFAGFVVSRCVIRMNDPSDLPTKQFLASGEGRVLDIGVGAGRASIMVGTSRPGTNLVCLDNFSAAYIEGHGPENTLSNLERAGLAGRARLETADMREMPFEPETFDAVVSSAAIDHLQPGEIVKIFGDVNRLLKPAGEVMLMVIVPNVYTAIAYGPLVHLHMMPRRFWRDLFVRAGFGIEGEGTSRGIAWFHARKLRALQSGELQKSVELPARTGAHAFNLRGLALPAAVSGGVCIGVALLLRLLGYAVSWWWVAAAVPVGMHTGIVLVALSAVFRWAIPAHMRNADPS